MAAVIELLRTIRAITNLDWSYGVCTEHHNSSEQNETQIRHPFVLKAIFQCYIFESVIPVVG